MVCQPANVRHGLLMAISGARWGLLETAVVVLRAVEVHYWSAASLRSIAVALIGDTASKVGSERYTF